ncbi:MAG: hypothetical protein IT373_04270 [Polyangiaceae bacterium]|nr:hypothetical protein [Polyangiaceae bacterium]
MGKLRDRLIGAALGAGAALTVAFGGCTLAREGTLSQECRTTAECDDASPCTEESCNAAGTCDRTVLPDHVLPDAEQVPADCQRLECSAGVLAALDDPLDLDDDGNDCTVDACAPGGPVHTPRSPNEACTDPQGDPGLCTVTPSDPAGVSCQALCTAATAQAACDDQNDCTLDSCDLSGGVCVNAPQNDVAAPQQAAGDCQLSMCVNGVATQVVDNSDAPAPPNECTTVACNEGTPSATPKDAGTPCGQGQVCNGDPVTPACSECNLPSDCTSPLPDDECRVLTCTSHLCGVSFTTVDTALSLQVAGDCLRLVCDGAGGTKQNVDTADLPVDGNECTSDVCSAQGVPSNPANGSGPCGNGGTCTNGVCGCSTEAQCPPDTFCRNYSCTAGSCVFAPTNVGVALTVGQTAHDCQELRCDAAGDVVSVVVDDPPADDGNVCTLELCVNGAPTVSNAPLDTTCETTRFCDGAGSCVECNASTQCDPSGCGCSQCTANACVDAASGTVAACQAAGDCKSNQCNGSGGTTVVVNQQDVPVDNQQCTLDQCAANGTPSNPDAPSGSACSENGGQVCDGGGNCVECMTVASCNLGQLCNTSHECKTLDAWPCSGDLDCDSGFCADGLCCNNACTALCKQCDYVLSLGTCTNVPTDQTPDTECPNQGESCKGGACKKVNGQACAGKAECVSNECVDGVCCNSACGTACWACTQAKTGSADGTCALITFDTDPNNDCSGSKCCQLGFCIGGNC